MPGSSIDCLTNMTGAGVVSYWMVREYVATRRRDSRRGRTGTCQRVHPARAPPAARPRLTSATSPSPARRARNLRAVQPSALLLGQGRAQGQCLGYRKPLLEVVTSTPSTCSAGCRLEDLPRQPQGRRRGFTRPSRQRGRGRQVDRRPFPLRHRSLHCQPGIQGAHEKGGVEGQIGWFRRNHLVPILEVDSQTSSTPWSTPGTKPTMPGGSALRPARSGNTSPPSSHSSRPSDRAVRDRPLVHPARGQVRPGHGLDEQASVPARMVGRQAWVLLNASDLVVFDGRTEIARHERLMTKGSTRVDLDHYLRGPPLQSGALPAATALEQARASGGSRPFTTPGGRAPQGPR